MLVDASMFNKIEGMLAENGIFDQFEQETGEPITKRMMITATELPSELELDLDPARPVQAFEASFDFYEATLNLVIYLDDTQVAGPIWVTPQVEGATEPAPEWLELFIKTLSENAVSGEDFKVPLFTFISENHDFTVAL